MTRRPDPLSVEKEFLQKRLRNGPVLVAELEAAARAAGLLGGDQPITDAKLFKRAKKSLGIRSVRNGFGSAGKWFWVLKTLPALSHVSEPPSEVAPRIPVNWIDGIGGLNTQRPPPHVPIHRWRQFLTDCTTFLASGSLAERAAALGWDAVALFGWCRHRPLDHSGGAGLLWAVNGGWLVELRRDWAVIELAENGSQRIVDRRRLDVENFRPPWIGA